MPTLFDIANLSKGRAYQAREMYTKRGEIGFDTNFLISTLKRYLDNQLVENQGDVLIREMY